MILIGSQAMKEHGVNCEPADIDIVLTYRGLGVFLRKNRHCSIEYFNKGLFRAYDSYSDTNLDLLISEECEPLAELFELEKVASETLIVASVEQLLVLRKAHLIFPINWNKNIPSFT